MVGDGMVVKVEYVKQGDLPGGRDGVHVLFVGRRAVLAGVRAFIVALSRGNARGAKGRREVDTGCSTTRTHTRRECLKGLNLFNA